MIDGRLLTVAIDYHGWWHILLFFGTATCAAWVLWQAPIDHWARVLWVYYIIRCLWILEFPSLPYGDFTKAFQATAGQGLAEGLLIPWAAIRMQYAASKTWERVGWAIMAFVVVEIGMVWTLGHGLLTASGSASMDTAFLAFSVGMGHFLGLVAAVTVLTHHGATALIILSCYATSYCLARRKLWCLIAALALFLGLAVLGARDGLLMGSGRVVHWTHYMGVWSSDWRNWIVGSGAGSFMNVSLLVDAFGEPQFLTMHSDVLQVLFDLGFIGLALALIVYVRLLMSVLRDGDWKHIGTVFGLGAWCMTYSPLRYFPSAMIVSLFAASWLKLTGEPESGTLAHPPDACGNQL